MTSKDHPVISTYRGKVVQDMTKKELIDAVLSLGRMYNHLLQDRIDDNMRGRIGG